MNKSNFVTVRAAVLVLAIFAALTIVLESINARTAGKPSIESAVGLTVEQADKNIKVLNGMPESQLIPTMKFVTVSLGVACTYCEGWTNGYRRRRQGNEADRARDDENGDASQRDNVSR